MEILVLYEDVRRIFLRGTADDIQRHAFGRSHHGNTFLDNARLVTRNPFQRPAAPLGMLHAHIRDDGHHRNHDIRGIQESPHAHLDNGIFHMADGKMEKCHGRQYLELCRAFHALLLHLLHIDLNGLQTIRKNLFADGLSVNLDALRIACQMW